MNKSADKGFRKYYNPFNPIYIRSTQVWIWASLSERLLVGTCRGVQYRAHEAFFVSIRLSPYHDTTVRDNGNPLAFIPDDSK